MERGRVSDNYSHLGGKAQTLEGGAFAFEVFHGEVEPDLVCFEKTIEFDASLKTEKLAELGLG